MTVDRDTVAHIARLAELAVPADAIASLTDDLDRIVRFVEELGSVATGDEADTSGAEAVVGPDRTPLRDDVVAPVPLAVPVASLAPAMHDGLFIVPRLGGMADE